MKIRFLLIEDDPSAAMIARLALEDGWQRRGVEAEIHACSNGLEALRYLERIEPASLPHLILTDIKMPLLDGLRLLEQLKQSQKFRAIPVIILSTSDDPGDIKRAFSGQCAGYLLKSASFEQFSAELEALQRYWEISRLP